MLDSPRLSQSKRRMSDLDDLEEEEEERNSAEETNLIAFGERRFEEPGGVGSGPWVASGAPPLAGRIGPGPTTAFSRSSAASNPRGITSTFGSASIDGGFRSTAFDELHSSQTRSGLRGAPGPPSYTPQCALTTHERNRGLLFCTAPRGQHSCFDEAVLRGFGPGPGKYLGPTGSDSIGYAAERFGHKSSRQVARSAAARSAGVKPGFSFGKSNRHPPISRTPGPSEYDQSDSTKPAIGISFGLRVVTATSDYARVSSGSPGPALYSPDIKESPLRGRTPSPSYPRGVKSADRLKAPRPHSAKARMRGNGNGSRERSGSRRGSAPRNTLSWIAKGESPGPAGYTIPSQWASVRRPLVGTFSLDQRGRGGIYDDHGEMASRQGALLHGATTTKVTRLGVTARIGL